MFDEADFDAEQGAEFFRGEQFPLRAVGEDAAFAHHDHAGNFRKDVGDVVGDHENADSLLRNAAEGLAEFALRGEVEGVGGLVEEEHLGAMDQGARDHDAALLACRHFADEFRFEVRGLHEMESLVGALAHVGRDVQIGPEGRGGEESCDDSVETAGDGGALAGKLGGDDAEVGAELGDVPTLAAEEAELGGGRDDGVALAGEGFDQRRFAAAVGAEDGDVFTVGDAKRDVVEDDVVAAGDADVAHEEEAGFGGLVQEEIIAERRIDTVEGGLSMSETSLISSEAVPRGFRFAAVKAGIKPSGRADFAVAVADDTSNQSASAAAMFTSNRVQAAPITVGRRHLARSGGRVRVVAVNAGNANCATGEVGITACEQVCRAAAEMFGCAGHEVFPSSTGIIGVPLPADKLVAALPEVRGVLASDTAGFSQFAQAILTTDTRAKVAHSAFEVDGKQVRIAGVCKGAGMIHPQLVAPHATMLVYVFTDALVDARALDEYLRGAVEVSFNRISIDGDTSTNDTVLLLASGASDVKIGASDTNIGAKFATALTEVCTSLAKQIVSDGEGVTHVVELQIEGAPSDADALRVAKSIAHSPLVKTAWAGSDPNWGRLMAAVGYSGVAIDAEKIAIWFGELPICVRGGRAPQYDEKAAHAYLQQREYSIRIALGMGEGRCRFWTCDLSAEYVRINAEYST